MRGARPHHWNALEALLERLVFPAPSHRSCTIPDRRPPHALRKPRARPRLSVTAGPQREAPATLAVMTRSCRLAGRAEGIRLSLSKGRASSYISVRPKPQTPQSIPIALSATNLHLVEISCNVAVGAHALLIFDSIGWHGASDLPAPDNITLLNHPADAAARHPETSPVDNVGQVLRENLLGEKISFIKAWT